MMLSYIHRFGSLGSRFISKEPSQNKTGNGCTRAGQGLRNCQKVLMRA